MDKVNKLQLHDVAFSCIKPLSRATLKNGLLSLQIWSSMAFQYDSFGAAHLCKEEVDEGKDDEERVTLCLARYLTGIVFISLFLHTRQAAADKWC